MSRVSRRIERSVRPGPTGSGHSTPDKLGPDDGGPDTPGAAGFHFATRGGQTPVPNVTTVVAVLAEGDSRTREAITGEIQQKLELDGNYLDLYIVRPGYHWGALGPKDLNPGDPEQGHDHRLFLKNLMPEKVIVFTTGAVRPDWCDQDTAVIEL